MVTPASRGSGAIWALGVASSASITGTTTLNRVIVITNQPMSGGLLGLTLFSIPAIKLAPVALRLSQWRYLYYLGKAAFRPAVLFSSLCSFYSAYVWYVLGAGPFHRLQRSFWCLIGAGLATLGIVPFTGLVMTPTNQELLGLEEEYKQQAEPSKGREEERVNELINKWGVLNAGRAALTATGTILGMIAMSEWSRMGEYWK
jgi:hypothetical protein